MHSNSNHRVLHSFPTRRSSDLDLAIVDPPYGIGPDWKKRKNTANKYQGEYTNQLIPNDEYFQELFRVSKNWIVWGWNYYINFFRSEEHTSELQSRENLVCRLLL